MSTGRRGAVVVDTMAVSALVNATRNPQLAAYQQAIAGDRIVVSFATARCAPAGASCAVAGWSATSSSSSSHNRMIN